MRTIAPSAHARGRPGLALYFSARLFGPLLQLARSAALVLSLSVLASCVPSKGTIGAVIAQDNDSGRLFLRDVPPNLAAARAQLKAGDEILLIDGLDVRRMDAEQINAMLSGEVDSPVKLTLIRQEQVLRVTLLRTEAHKLSKKPARSP
jgi:C-terminal processing protease CtpA/Prc